MSVFVDDFPDPILDLLLFLLFLEDTLVLALFIDLLLSLHRWERRGDGSSSLENIFTPQR